MDTAERNQALAKAVKTLGANEVTMRLGVSQRELLQFAYGDRPVSDAFWTLVANENIGLLRMKNPSASQSRAA